MQNPMQSDILDKHIGAGFFKKQCFADRGMEEREGWFAEFAAGGREESGSRWCLLQRRGG